MQITISGEAREIASLVLALQGKPQTPVSAETIRRTLLEQREESAKQGLNEGIAAQLGKMIQSAAEAAE